MGLFNEVLRGNKEKVNKEKLKYTPEEIDEKVDTCIKIMSRCKNLEDINGVFENVVMEIGDIELAFELYSFIPDVYCRVIFPEVFYDDEIIFKLEDGKEYELSSTGFFGYIQVQNAVFERINKKLDNDIQEKIIIHSINFKKMNKALNEGEEMSNIRIGAMILNAPKGYNPFRYVEDEEM
ncbi:MAG: hypothetical protein ACRC2K_13815 [Clostridium sp.]